MRPSRSAHAHPVPHPERRLRVQRDPREQVAERVLQREPDHRADHGGGGEEGVSSTLNQ